KTPTADFRRHETRDRPASATTARRRYAGAIAPAPAAPLRARGAGCRPRDPAPQRPDTRRTRSAGTIDGATAPACEIDWDRGRADRRRADESRYRQLLARR